jgi:hypothetical protein
VKIHRTIHIALLALLLLLSQQMGIVHAVSHLSGKPDSRTEQQLPFGQACDQCLAFAAVGSALTGNGLLAALQTYALSIFALVPGTLYFPATVWAFHSRAPPLTI